MPVVALVVLWPALLAIWLAWRSHDVKVWAYVILAGAAGSLIAIQFYIQYWPVLRAYYGVHSALINQRWTLDGAMQFILNVPGFMYWRVENSPVCVALTLASHLFVLSMFAIAWWPRGLFSKPRHFAFRHLVTGGAVIYFGTYLRRHGTVRERSVRLQHISGTPSLAADAHWPFAHTGGGRRRESLCPMRRCSAT